MTLCSCGTKNNISYILKDIPKIEYSSEIPIRNNFTNPYLDNKSKISAILPENWEVLNEASSLTVQGKIYDSKTGYESQVIGVTCVIIPLDSLATLNETFELIVDNIIRNREQIKLIEHGTFKLKSNNNAKFVMYKYMEDGYLYHEINTMFLKDNSCYSSLFLIDSNNIKVNREFSLNFTKTIE